MATNLEDVIRSIQTEDLGTQTIDLDAPEPGSVPPQVSVGSHQFQFNDLEEVEPWGTGNTNGRKYITLKYRAQCLDNDKELRFQRVSGYKSEKMANSTLAEFCRSLGINDPNLNLNDPQALADVLLPLAGRGTFGSAVVWRAWNKDTGETFSTNANIKKGEQRVPRNADGSYPEQIEWPDGTKQYLSAEINPFRFKLPTVAVTA